jgi:hypothetical protein
VDRFFSENCVVSIDDMRMMGKKGLIQGDGVNCFGFESNLIYITEEKIRLAFLKDTRFINNQKLWVSCKERGEQKTN